MSPQRIVPGGPSKSPANEQFMETAGIEPASAVAQKVVSTSVSGALISSSTRHAGGVVKDQLRKNVLGLAGAGLAE
jgi:hypothetical protein